MEKKSKLAIKHYHGKELEKIGKSANGFPLYVMVRYQNVKTKFASRFGMRFVKENGGDSSVLSAYNRGVISIIEEEAKHIEMLRNYFEEVLSLEFTPSVLVNEFFENTALERVVDYFDQIFEDEELKKILIGIDQDLIDLFLAAGPVRFLSGLRYLDLKLFNQIMMISEVKMIFEYYEIYKSLNWPEVNRIQFRMQENCLMNGYAEQKNGLIKHHFMPTVRDLEENGLYNEIKRIIRIYNYERKQEGLGWLSPVEFEKKLPAMSEKPERILHKFTKNKNGF